MNRILLPGATIGVLGSGQLGRMLALEARRMGYRVHTLSPEVDTPTGQVADLEVEAAYDDLDAIRAFARSVDVVTFEFENVSTDAADAAAEIVPVRPSGSALHITQQRAREKAFLADHGYPVTPFAKAQTLDELAVGLGVVGLPAIVKTAAFGYDGKGQHRIDSIEDGERVWGLIGRQEAIVERLVQFTHEISVVAARGLDGQFAHFGAVENQHRHHILDLTLSPARIAEGLAAEAVHLARRVLDDLGFVGVLCVEFFVTSDGRLLVNEIAPRPHNSGHLTIDACVTSQFEQQVRAVCGMSLGDATQVKPAAMVNLLGDLWINGEPDWAAALAMPDVKLHLYGKSGARVGRKMGHLTALGDTVEEAAAKALAARDVLC
ncbi:MAG TPA: 5-(carboxyamino)imidazole ribonucleotide synthase [Vicinamibacterales bacterium]|nr:5-(carboxyamino)imidazole ribonucleotide synthase [Vicinamibacterales bacterium]